MSRLRKLRLPGSPSIVRCAPPPPPSTSSPLVLCRDPPSRPGCPGRRWKTRCSPPETPPARAPPPPPPFRFETGVGVFAKRTPRPFPPPFLSPPSISFSDPLSTHDRSRDRRAFVNGEIIRGITNGDDAVFASENFICANDGVGAWAARHRGHAGLWSRLMLHFWALEVEQEPSRARPDGSEFHPDPVATLEAAYEQTKEATSAHDWQGTTTTCGAQMHHRTVAGAGGAAGKGPVAAPLLYVTNLGDGQVLVLRPRQRKIVFKTAAQWHWFDCPRQLGTNSPDTPRDNAAVDVVDLEVGDVVLAMSDGVTDNLWEHEIAARVFESVEQWRPGGGVAARSGESRSARMDALAHELVTAAKDVATDPFAESPYMEHAIEEGLASEGGERPDGPGI